VRQSEDTMQPAAQVAADDARGEAQQRERGERRDHGPQVTSHPVHGVVHHDPDDQRRDRFDGNARHGGGHRAGGH
jgi:hypothetical protein